MQAVVVRIHPPGTVLLDVFLLVDDDGQRGEVGCFEELEQFGIELGSDGDVLQDGERPLLPEDLLAVQDHRIVGM